jgi:long-chain acyl-CoA synthetase
LDVQIDRHPEAIYDPEAILALVYTSGTTGHPKGVVVTHANILANVDHLNYWMPYREGGVHLHAAPIFHILDFPFMFAAPAFGACQVAIPKFSPQSFCETVQRARQPIGVGADNDQLADPVRQTWKLRPTSLKHWRMADRPWLPSLCIG